MKYIYPVIVLLLLLPSCAKKKAKKQAEEDDNIIKEYIATHNLIATKTESGLYYVIENQGTGAGCSGFSDVTVAYTGYFTDDTQFEQSDAAGITLNLGGVIEGWHEGVPYFKEGGTGKLLCPSALAYGTNGNATIPPNTVIIFDINLIDVL